MRRDVIGMVIGAPPFVTRSFSVLFTTQYTNTRGTAWGGGNSSIVATFQALWTSPAQAAAFWAAPYAEMRFRFAQLTVSTAQDTAWANIFSGIGTITLGKNATTRSGTLGTPAASIGYNQLTTSAQTIFGGINIGAGAYSANDVFLTAAKLNDGIQFVCTLSDQHTAIGAGPDAVHAGTTLYSDIFTTHGAINTTLPTFTTVSGF